ncbi:MAG TPA: hypothetical protein VKG26_01790 [Bacteroidia bacterium]|nr:hypothetical protein [Bacteroidia bacterium]
MKDTNSSTITSHFQENLRTKKNQT